MISLTLCNSCLQPFEIVVTPGEIEMVKSITDDTGKLCKCPRLCGGFISLAGDPTITAMAKDPRLKSPMRLSGAELFKAVNGVGLPDEVPRDVVTVEALLKAHKVVDMDLSESGGRIYLNELKLENGVTLHLTAGARGALVCKITKEHAHGV